MDVQAIMGVFYKAQEEFKTTWGLCEDYPACNICKVCEQGIIDAGFPNRPKERDMTEVHRAAEKSKIRDARIIELTEKIEKQDMEIENLKREITSLLDEIDDLKYRRGEL